MRICKRLILSTLISGIGSTALLAQADTVVNQYARVLSRSDYQVVVDDASAFHNGDYVLIIQMQGVAIDASDSPTYGRGANQLVGIPGRYEFLIIQSVSTVTRTITFLAKINKYDPAGSVQIIRVPFFNSLSSSKVLTCKPWDRVSKTGGVLALLVGDTLTLNQNIDVSGKGFTGGKDTIGLGDCSYPSGINGIYSFPRSFKNAGYKGEGLASHQSFCLDPCIPALLPSYLKGQGPLFTGGGGGNGKFSGGGGGSNRGKGGQGGNEYYECLPNLTGGISGVSVTDIVRLDTVTGGIFMGGGGGSSTKFDGAVSKAGGNGGGIVIIVTDKLIGNGNKIIADGNSVSTAKLLAGAGGGGAGGSIAISSNTLANVVLSTKGGNGGNHIDDFGQGGGGGGGLIWVSQNSQPATVTNILNGGANGIDTIFLSSNAIAGDPGLTKYSFRAQLNGFLFNSIRSSVTGNQADSICSNVLPPTLTGTKPVGGTPGSGYIFLWEKSYDAAFTTRIPLVNDPDPTNYTPTLVETSTVWYRRTVTDHSTPDAIVDKSIPVKITVQPFIKNNIIGNSDTLCYAQNASTFTSKASLQDGNGLYAFNWQVSTDNVTFTTPANTNTLESYTPPAPLTAPANYYRRTVTSGRCVDATAIVKITVLDSIANNKILNIPSDICFGGQFTDLSGSTTSTAPDPLKGGDNLYRYQWESNINSAGWGNAPGISTGTGYNPIELPQKSPFNQYIFRRVVYSGSNNVCASTSNSVSFKDYPVITGNTIAPPVSSCSGSQPAILVGSKTPVLAGGNGIYTYSWEDSSKVDTWKIINLATEADYQPQALTDTTSYRRIVNSSACVSYISNSVRINVHKPILNNNISLVSGGNAQTLCYNQVPVAMQGTPATGGTGIAGDYAYLWKYSTDNNIFNAVPAGGTSVNYAPPALTATTYYRRDVVSGACTVSSTPVLYTVLPLISNNTLTGKSSVCKSRVPDPVIGLTPSNGDGTYKYFWQQSTNGGATWNTATGINNLKDYQPPALYIPTSYLRLVTSGPAGSCSSISPSFNIGIDPLPASPLNAGPDSLIYSIDKLYHMKALPPLSGETGSWRVLSDGKSTIDDTTSYKTIVRNLVLGKNSFLWTLTRGLCTLKDSVTIQLLKDFIPEGFSPNGDTYNNTFIIEGLNPEDNYVDLSIVNGAGTEVFSSSNRNSQKWTDWDGKNSKGLDLPEGTYYYLLKITPIKQGSQVYKRSGFIILKRY